MPSFIGYRDWADYRPESLRAAGLRFSFVPQINPTDRPYGSILRLMPAAPSDNPAQSGPVSMTGHGEASGSDANHAVTVEIRTVNNRFLKTSIRLSEGFSAYEPRIEEKLKKSIQRGSVYVTVKIDRHTTEDDMRLNEEVLRSYHRQLQQVFPDAMQSGFRPELLLQLPGIIEFGQVGHRELENFWTTLAACIDTAVERLDDMRRREGAAMAANMEQNCQEVAEELEHVAKRAPEVVASYQQRLTERLNQMLSGQGITLDPKDVTREVGLFADRCDISEEVVRLRSHLDQFSEILQSGQAAGKKLDFLTQELFREVNTIGSKANDAKIAQHVIQMKAAIERIREMTQNLE